MRLVGDSRHECFTRTSCSCNCKNSVTEFNFPLRMACSFSKCQLYVPSIIYNKSDIQTFSVYSAMRSQIAFAHPYKNSGEFPRSLLPAAASPIERIGVKEGILSGPVSDWITTSDSLFISTVERCGIAGRVANAGRHVAEHIPASPPYSSTG